MHPDDENGYKKGNSKSDWKTTKWKFQDFKIGQIEQTTRLPKRVDQGLGRVGVCGGVRNLIKIASKVLEKYPKERIPVREGMDFEVGNDQHYLPRTGQRCSNLCATSFERGLGFAARQTVSVGSGGIKKS